MLSEVSTSRDPAKKIAGEAALSEVLKIGSTQEGAQWLEVLAKGPSRDKVEFRTLESLG